MNSQVAKRRWQRVDGVLLLDKALGLSSNTALQQVRRLYSAAKAGHTGTLDPLATGLLPICFGEATKFSADLLDADKRYTATLQLGQRTTTGDREGEIIDKRPVHVEQTQLESVLTQFCGPISQCPPMYSAIKQDGKTLYQLARQGIEVERPLRQIHIYELRLHEFSGTRCVIDVRCSKGTYIRTLAEDIGEALGCGAHLSDLRRTAVGALRLNQAHRLEALQAMDEPMRWQQLLPVDTLLSGLPKILLDSESAKRFTHGNPVAALAPQDRCRVYRQDSTGARLLGIGDGDDAGQIHPRRLLAE